MMTQEPEPAAATLDGAQLQDRAVRGVAWTMIHTVVSVPIAFLVNLLLARVLGTDDYGRLAVLTTLITVVGSILALGLSSAMIQFGSKAHAAGRSDEVRRILSGSQGFRLLVVAPVLTLLVALVVDVPLPLLLVGIVAGVWLPAALDGAGIALFIESKTASGARIALVTNLVVQAGVVATVLTIGTADSVWAVRTAITGACIGLALLAVSAAYRRAVLRPRLPRGFPAGFWRFALPTGAAALIGELVVSRTEVLFLEALSTPTAVGLFALAFGVSSHIFAPAQALTGPLIPAISGLREVSEGQVAAAFGRALRGSTTVVALLTASALPALTILVPLLYGSEYADAAPAVLVLGCAGALGVLSGPVSAFILARLSARVFLTANLLALAVDVALAVTLIPPFGLWGAVAANIGGMLTRLTILVVTEQRALDLRVRDVLGALTPLLVCIPACIASWALLRDSGLAVVLAAAVASALALGLVLAGLRLTGSGLAPADRDVIARVLPTRARGLALPLLRLVTRRT